MKPAWAALVVLNALLAVGAALAAFPHVVLVRALLAEQGWTTIDPTLVDDGLYIIAVFAVITSFVLAAVAVPANVFLAHRTGLRGRPWPWVALVVLIGGGLLINRFVMAELW